MDKFPEAFKRFEKEIDLSDSKDSDDVIRKFRIWQSERIPTVSRKQQMLIREIVKEKGLIIVPPRKRKGISEIKGKPRKELKRHYTVHKVRGKMQRVARIPKGMKGAGRFA